MKKTTTFISALLLTVALIGCGPSDATLSKNEEDSLKNPGKTIPPEAAAGMSKMGDLVKQQQEANKAAGVDSRGLPIESSTEKEPPKVGPK